MRPIDFNDAQQALAFLVPQLMRIQAEVYEVRYPAFAYEDLVFVNTDGDMWDAGVIFYSGDIAGEAEFLNSKANDMPYADVSREQFLTATHLAGIGYEYSRGELERAARLGQNLTADKARAATRRAEKFIYDIATIGSEETGLTGLFNDPNVPAVVAGQTFTAGTPEQVLAIINGALAAPSIATRGAYNANTIILPTTAIRDLASRVLTNTTTTFLAFVQANNSLTAQTQQALTFRASDDLETAGAGGTRRMVTYDRSPEAQQFALPGPHEFLDPWRKSSMTWEVAGIMNIGGYDGRIPKAMRYTDGI
jgi:hypothetical protein